MLRLDALVLRHDCFKIDGDAHMLLATKMYHGLRQIGLDSSMDWIGLSPMTVMYKIMTAYVFS